MQVDENIYRHIYRQQHWLANLPGPSSSPAPHLHIAFIYSHLHEYSTAANLTLTIQQTGHGLTLQHFRYNSECNVYEELEPIDTNLRYDFNYQQFTHLQRIRTVLPVRCPIWLECCSIIWEMGMCGPISGKSMSYMPGRFLEESMAIILNMQCKMVFFQKGFHSCHIFTKTCSVHLGNVVY